ncbi:MAG: YceI family protein [Hyphomonas sp.]
MTKPNMLILMAAAAAALATAACSATAGAPADNTQTDLQIPAGVYVLDPAHGKITWSVSHLGYSTYVGQFPDVAATLEFDPDSLSSSTVEAVIDMNKVGTLNAALDAHLKTADFFDTANFPTASFVTKSVEVTDVDSAVISGDLTLRGVTRPVSFDADFNMAGVNPLDQKFTLGFDGQAVIRRSEFGVSYGLPMVGDEVELHIEAEFKLQDAGDTAGAGAQ